jgi:hypothetical protein
MKILKKLLISLTMVIGVYGGAVTNSTEYSFFQNATKVCQNALLLCSAYNFHKFCHSTNDNETRSSLWNVKVCGLSFFILGALSDITNPNISYESKIEGVFVPLVCAIPFIIN